MALDYDNSAFYYFAITCLFFYLIPGTYYALTEIKEAFFMGNSKALTARTGAEATKAQKLKKNTRGFARLKTWSFMLNLFFLIIAFILFAMLVNNVMTNGEVQRFDPYQILGIDTESSTSEIKKAYRKLSLKFHPDKNPGDKVAEEMFMKIAKAYESLTDETARENYMKFGNPDGKQSLEVSIGLPVWLLENPKVVMVLYLIAMCVIIPIGVGLWYSNSKQYGEKNITYETYSRFYQLISEQHRVKMLPEVFASAEECHRLYAARNDNKEAYAKLFGQLRVKMQRPRFEQPPILQTNLLLHAHMLQMRGELNPEMNKHLDSILEIFPELVEGMIEIAFQRRWLQTTIATIKFSQCVIQGLWHDSSSLMQIPYITENDVKQHMTRGKNSVKSLRDYILTPDADKKGLNDLKYDEKADVLMVCNEIFPRLKVDYKLFVEDDEEEGFGDDYEEVTGSADTSKEDEKAANESNAVVKSGSSMSKYAESKKAREAISGDSIYEGDLITLRIKIDRENVEENEEAPFVHAPDFPRPVKEFWWAVLTDKPKAAAKGGPEPPVTIYAIEKITDQRKHVVHELRFGAPPKAGTYAVEIHLISNCYMGLDMNQVIEFNVSEASELPEFVPHPEDVALDDEPTMFEQMMAANQDVDSSDDEDENDAGANDVARRRKQAGDDDSDSSDSDSD
jgi:translocation protein SEC63